MKATGIVRRIDDLGRVVIPKEIRRTMRIREGDPLEIFTDNDGEVVFKKYSPVGEMTPFALQYADVMSRAVSEDSPFGKALMGHKAGEEVAVEAPRGVIRYRIDKIER